MAAVWESLPVVGRFKPTTLVYKRHDLSRLATTEELFISNDPYQRSFSSQVVSFSMKCNEVYF